MNKKGKDYLNKIKKELDIPIISKITREKDPMLEYELETTTRLRTLKGGHTIGDKKCEIIL